MVDKLAGMRRIIFSGGEPMAFKQGIAYSQEVSFDEGRTWRRVDSRRDGDRWQVRIPAGGYASLRAVASDVDG
jgi:hypothetical protein